MREILISSPAYYVFLGFSLFGLLSAATLGYLFISLMDMRAGQGHGEKAPGK